MTVQERPTLTAEDYRRVFDAERVVEYPVVDAFEQRMGFAIDRAKLEEAARVLACPVKANPPNWQHGRVLYALARHYVAKAQERCVMVLDVGTAKGFSALSMFWAFHDAGCVGTLHSVDVIHPKDRVRRNTVAEVNGLCTLPEILRPWPESALIPFAQSTGIDMLLKIDGRIHFAFIDGKHSADVVLKEGKLLADRQQSGDVVMFDDCQIDGVARAVAMLDPYEFEYVDLAPVKRRYAIGRRK